jgi:holin-like protein
VIAGLLALCLAQLAGEFLVNLVDMAVPGPVVGMVLMLGWLTLRDPAPESGIVQVADGLLKHMQLLFIPAGVGVVQYLSVIGAAALPLVVGLVASWAAALLVTAATAAALLALGRRWRRA